MSSERMSLWWQQRWLMMLGGALGAGSRSWLVSTLLFGWLLVSSGARIVSTWRP